MSRVSAHSTPDGELTLTVMLADPIVQMLMARDGVTKQNVEGLIVAVRGRLAERQMENQETSAQESDAVVLGQ